MKNNAHTTIIKRSIRRSHQGHHGGAWKVAFADFTLAMMALFMVLWIVGAVSEDERKEIVAQLHGQSVFSGSGFNPFDVENEHKKALVAQTRSLKPPVLEATVSDNDIPESTHSGEPAWPRSDGELAALKQQIEQVISTHHAQNHLTLDTLPQGLRILIQDDRERMMFPRGSAVLTPYFQRLLTELGPVFNRIDNQIMISGHTDAVPYEQSAAYNNWNLSGDRALAARRALERGGLESARVLQVNAVAARMPLDRDDPLNARNRRVEIMVLTASAAETLLQFYGRQGEKVVKPIVARLKS